MTYSLTLMLTSVVMVIGSMFSLAVNDGQLSLLAYAIPLLFFAHSIQPAIILFGLGLFGFGLVTSSQPVSLSLSVWMIMPVFVLMTCEKRNWQVSALVLSVVFAMECGVLALQQDGKLDGEMLFTLIQLLSVFFVWAATYMWRPVDSVVKWPTFLILLLFIFGLPYDGLFALCVTVLAFCLQEIKLKSRDKTRGEKLAVILPAIGFASITAFPQFTVPNAIFVAWLLCLTITWLGDYLINNDMTNEE